MFPVTRLCFAVQGVLKGYDQLLNLVMDETVEFLRGKGLPTVCFLRANQIMFINFFCVGILFMPRCAGLEADPEDSLRVTDQTRSLGLIVSRPPCVQSFAVLSLVRCCRKASVPYSCLTLQVCRGTAVMMVAPSSGMEEIANPFAAADE
jgi:LSM domain